MLVVGCPVLHEPDGAPWVNEPATSSEPRNCRADNKNIAIKNRSQAAVFMITEDDSAGHRDRGLLQRRIQVFRVGPIADLEALADQPLLGSQVDSGLQVR